MDRKRKRKREKNRKRNQRRKRSRNPLRDVDVFLRTTFYSIIPDKRHQQRCRELIQKVRNAIAAAYEQSEVVVYGSHGCGIALPDSDIDLCVRMETTNRLSRMRRITTVLQCVGIRPPKYFWELPMSVPGGTVLVYFAKCLDLETEIELDISLNNPMSHFDSAFIKAVVDFHFINKMFLVLIKYFATCQRLNESEGGLPNSGHVLLGILVLQKNNVIPRFLREEQITDLNELVSESESYNIGNENFLKQPATVASLLIDYFQYYSEEVDYTQMAISFRGSCLVTKESLGWHNGEKEYTLAIVNPFSGVNAGAKVTESGLFKIKTAFKIATEILASGSHLERLFQLFDLESYYSKTE